MVRDLSLVGPLTVTAEPALLGLARTALRSYTALAVVRERQATARLAIWWPGGRPQDERPLTAGRPCRPARHPLVRAAPLRRRPGRLGAGERPADLAPGPAPHRSGAWCGAGPGGDETSHAGPGDGR